MTAPNLITGKCVNRWADFEPNGDQRIMTPEQVEAAKRICIDCPVFDACRAYAEAVRPVCGVWAGQEWVPERMRSVNDYRDFHHGRPRAIA